MPRNYLITGAPGSGKTTVIERVQSRLEAEGYVVGGIVCPDRREGGQRVGFDIVDVMTGETRVLADINRAAGPAVGKYRVDVDAVDAVCSTALPRAFADADIVIVDEIAPMEVYSDAFTTHVREALDRELPVLAAIHERATTGFIGAVKARDDIEEFVITGDSRDDLPTTLTERITGHL